MKVAVFSAKRYDRELLAVANAEAGHELVFFDDLLETATVALTAGCGAVCVFVNDRVDAPGLRRWRAVARLVALRCTGFNNVDLTAAAAVGIDVVRVTEYSPYSVAEHAVALILALNRKIHRAYNRTREGNFELDGLLGSRSAREHGGCHRNRQDRARVRRIMTGFGCQLLGYDKIPSPDFEAMGGRYVQLPELAARSDIVSLHCPLTPRPITCQRNALALVKRGAILINTSRGGLIDTAAVIEALKSGQLGALGIDVYEQEADSVLRGPVEHDHRRRCVPAAADLPERDGHRPPGVLYPRSDRNDLRNDDFQHLGLQRGQAAGARGACGRLESSSGFPGKTPYFG